MKVASDSFSSISASFFSAFFSCEVRISSRNAVVAALSSSASAAPGSWYSSTAMEQEFSVLSNWWRPNCGSLPAYS